MVRRLSVVVRPSLTMLKDLLLKAKIYVEPPWVGGTIFCSRHLGHMTKMAATPIYGKNPSNPRADFHETCYVASGTPAHCSLFK